MAQPSSYYCSKCQVDYEVDKPCPTCGQAVFPRYAQTHGHQKPSVVEHDVVGTQRTGDQVAHAWRIERYLELGFTELEANLLAEQRDSVRIPDRTGTPRTCTFPLAWQKVAAAIERGCSLPLALSIFADYPAPGQS